MVFYAIFWGFITEGQHRWKAFQLPLFCRLRWPRNRIILSMLIFNLLPLVFFGYIMWALHAHNDFSWDHPFFASCHLVGHGVIPAFAIFGFYRLWLSVVEFRPK